MPYINTYSLGNITVIDNEEKELIEIYNNNINKHFIVYKTKPKDKAFIVRKDFNLKGYLRKYKTIYYEKDLYTEDVLQSTACI